MKNKVVFLDRDGTLIKLVYNPDIDTIDSVSRVEDLELTYDFPEVLKKLKERGFLLIVVSNQPKVALKKETKENAEKIRTEFDRRLDEQGVKLDSEYYCFHHPFAEIPELKQNCDCRKPGIKSFRDAQTKFDIDMSQSYMIGDGVNDILAGHKAGVKTILFGNVLEAGYLSILEEQLKDIKPDFIIKKPKDILEIIQE